jgi:hypothetical protein
MHTVITYIKEALLLWVLYFTWSSAFGLYKAMNSPDIVSLVYLKCVMLDIIVIILMWTDL